MADRFVLVSTRKWRDPWYRTLTLEQKQVWNYLTEYPDETQTGIIERLHEDMASDCQIEISSFEGALDRFETDGRILREGGLYLFVIKWLRHQIRQNEIKWIPDKKKKADNRVIALNLALERLRDKCPILVAEFEEVYKGIPSPYEGTPKGLPYIKININNKNNTNNKPETPQQEKVFSSDDDKPTSLPEVTRTEGIILAELSECPNHKPAFEYMKSLTYIRKLFVEFSTLEILLVVKDIDYWLQDNPTKNCNHSRLRTFCGNAQRDGNHQIHVTMSAKPKNPDQIRFEKQIAEKEERNKTPPTKQELADAAARREQFRIKKPKKSTPEEMEQMRIKAEADQAAHKAKQASEAE